MSHYNVNASVPKTLVQYLVRYVARTGQLGADASQVLHATCSTPRSARSSCPATRTAASRAQTSESVVGPYELQDFHLYYTLRFGYLPQKVAFLAWHAWRDRTRGTWPDIPQAGRNEYPLARDQALAARVRAPVLPAVAVQAQRDPQRAEGRLGRVALAAQRLARAERRRSRRLARGGRRDPGMTLRGLAGFADGAASGPLLPALAASVALHAALLAGLPDFWIYSERPATAPLNAWLEPGARTAAVAELPAAAPLAERDAPQPKRAAPVRTPPAAAVPVPVPVAVTRPERAEPAPSPAAEPATVAAASAPGAGATSDAPPALALGTPTLAPRPGDDALEAGSLAQYRLALIGAAKRLKHYPAQAIDRGLEGRVDVRLVIGADGAPAAVLVKRSSGHEVLDRQAVDTMRKATAATPIPPALRNREIVVEIPLLYELRSES